MLFSVIIRTKNEAQFLQKTLDSIFSQGYSIDELEVIIVDSGSIDTTLAIAKQYNVHIIEIAPEKFSYPYASNIGAQLAHGKYLIYLSGHSVPMTKTMLRDALVCWKQMVQGGANLAGIYGPIVALPDRGSSIWEKMLFSAHRLCRLKTRVITQRCMGLLGCTNAIILRSVWKKAPFDKRYGLGGEDTAWAAARIDEGYSIGFCPQFAVYHSHGLGLFALYKQWNHWKGNIIPQPFDANKMRYRETGLHER